MFHLIKCLYQKPDQHHWGGISTICSTEIIPKIDVTDFISGNTIFIDTNEMRVLCINELSGNEIV